MLNTMLRWLIALLIAAAIFAQQSAPDAKPLASLEGSVVNALTNEPVRKANVSLELAGQAEEIALVATTDEAGHFRFADIEPGRYKLDAKKTGFLEGSYGSTKPARGGSFLHVDGDRMSDLTVSLFPGAAISGQLLDADGDPSVNHEVVLWSQRRERGKVKTSRVRQTITDLSGEYRFSGLSPGTYYVGTTADKWANTVRQVPVDSSGHISNVRDLATFYPASISLANAQPTRLECGQEQSGIDVRIQRGPALSVKGRINGIGPASSKLTLSASIDAGIGTSSTGGALLPNGEFQFAQLPPGKHRLSLIEHGTNGVRVIGQTEVDLTDQDLAGIVINRFKPAEIRVQVVFEGEEDKPLTAGSVFLFPMREDDDVLFRYMQYQPQQSTYIIDGVPPGKYQPLFNNAKDSYLKSIRSGESTLNPEAIDVTEGAVLNLRMIFSRNGASVVGDVDIAQDKPNKAVHVILIAEEGHQYSLGKFHYPSMDQSFHFSMKHMRPGKYLAFAAEDEDWDLWQNAEAVKLLQSKSTTVELHEKEQVALHLKPIPKAEMDRVREQLGY